MGELWRDVAMILIGVIGVLNMILYKEIKDAIFSKADKSMVEENSRKIIAHDAEIGKLYSRLYDEKVATMAQITQNQAAVIAVLNAKINSLNK